MINPKTVIRMKIPFDNNADLAYKSHMYICKRTSGLEFEFVKCQTIKPYMLIHNPINHFIDEQPDFNRNPFSKPTRIDCDKLFKTYNICISDSLITTTRPDVCDDLYKQIIEELEADGFMAVNLNEQQLVSLNVAITFA